MTPRFQKFAWLAHIAFSVGWFGAVVPYLALAIAGLASQSAQTVRAAYLSMELIGWFVIVPFSFAALLSGLGQSLGTRWGLFRHWWIVGKFVLTVVALIVLLRHMGTVSYVARIASEATSFGADFRALQIQLLIHPSGGLVVLFVAMTLSVFKPWGMTPYGRRRTTPPYVPSAGADVPLMREPVLTTSTRPWGRIVKIHAIHAIALILLFLAILHLTGGGIPHSLSDT